MRILQLTSARYFGGGERHVVDLARELRDRGHDVFAAIAATGPLRRELSFLDDDRIEEFPFRGVWDLPSLRAFCSYASKHKVDLIHAHVAKDYAVAATASKLTSIPFVITRHVMFAMSPLHRHLLSGARFVIAPSNAVAESLRSQNIFPDEKIATISHGVVTRKARVEKPDSDDGFVVGSVGNLDPVKGFDVLIRAAAIVAGEMPNVRFEIAGEDREADGRNRKELSDLIASLGLADRVMLTGWSSNIYDSIARYDLFVSSSRSESFGYALADSMNAGVPVLATETEGAKEVLGDTGMFVPSESPDVLARRIVELLSDERKRENAAKIGRERIRSHFSMTRMIDETESLYRRAIEPV